MFRTLRIKRVVAVFVTCLILYCFPVRALADENPPLLEAWDNGFVIQTDGEMRYTDTEGQTQDMPLEDPDAPTMLMAQGTYLFAGYPDGKIIKMDPQGQIIEAWQVDGIPIDIAQTDDAFFIATTEKIIVMDPAGEDREFFMEYSVVGIAAAKYAVVAAEEDGTLLIWTEDKTFIENTDHRNMVVTDIRAVNDVIYVTGYDREDRPVLLYTLAGGVWSERNLVMTQDTSAYEELDAIPLDIDYSDALEALLLSCTDGYIAVLPSCVKCNAFYRIGEGDLTDIAVNGEYIGVLEDGGALRIIESSRIPTRDNPAGDCNGGC